MKVNKKDPIHKENKDFAVYLILEENGKRFIVDKCKYESLYMAYCRYFTGCRVLAKDLFFEQRKKNLRPRMYLLDRNNETTASAHSRCVAWSKKMIDLGFIPLAREKFIEQTKELTKFTQAIYNSIGDIEIGGICGSEVFPFYGVEKENNTKNKNKQVRININKKEYQDIKEKAEKENMSIPEYCKKRTLKKKIVSIDMNPMRDVVFELRETKHVLEMMLYTIHETGQYEKADIQNVNRLVDEIRKSEETITKESLQIYKRLRSF